MRASEVSAASHKNQIDTNIERYSLNPRQSLALGLFVLLLSLQQLGSITNASALNNRRAPAAFAELKAPTKMETVSDDIHDIAIVGVSLSTNGTYPGRDVYVQVAVKNQGNLAEEFNVTVYANQSSKIVIDVYNVESLGSSNEIVIPFLWKLIGISPGNYDIVAESSVVDGETNISNNVQTNNLLILPDNTSPVIGVPVQNPSDNEILVYTDVHVRVNVTDLESGVDGVFLSLKVENNSNYDGATWMNETMTELSDLPGTYEDSINSYDYWSGTIVRYRIVALDKAGNEQIRDNAGMFYVYHIIPEFPSFLVLPLFMTATLLTVILCKKKEKLSRSTFAFQRAHLR